MLRSDVTTCLPTLITAEEATLGARLAALDAAVAASRLGPLMVPGFHLEGPFLNPSPGLCRLPSAGGDDPARPGCSRSPDRRTSAARSCC